MTNKSNLILFLSMLLVGLLFLAACGGDSGESASQPAAEGGEEVAPVEEGGEEAPAEAGGEAVTIRVWTHQNDAFNDGLQEIADAYTAGNPDVTFEFETFDYDTYIQTLQTALPAGTEADVLQMFGTWTCSYVDNLAPVPESVITLSDAQGAMFDAPLMGYTCDETLYGLPQEFNIEYGATLVNTAIAEEAGISDVTAGWDNWDDFIADAKAMTGEQDGVITRAGYNYTSGDAIGFTFLSLLKQFGGEYMNEDGTAFTLNTPEGKQALELMKRMTDEGIIDPVLFNDESNWVGDCYFEEACAMGLVGPWAIADYSGDFPETADVTTYVALPSAAGDPTFVADSGWGMTVSNNSEVQDAAWDFIKFAALNEENALNWNIGSGTLPALKANVEGAAGEKLVSEFAHFGPFLDVLPYGQYMGAMPDRDLLWYDIMYPHILNVLQGAETVDDALSAMEQEANESFN
jgi:multiple sugar transport system substrate-binding protein